MFATLPATAQEFGHWAWDQIAPYYADLKSRPLTADSVTAWLTDWSRLGALFDETNARLYIATTVNTADEDAERRYKTFLDDVEPRAASAEQDLKQRLIESGLEPAGFELPLRKLRTDAALFREENLPLLAEARKLALGYEQIAGERVVEWAGKQIPLPQLFPVLEEPDRDRRERAYRTMADRVIQDTPALSEYWREVIHLRHRIAANAGFDSYRSFRWQQLYRYDYTPDDAKRFHAAIAEVAVPAARRLNEQRRRKLGVPTLRPWDVYVDPHGREPLRPYATIDELTAKTSNIFHHTDPQLGDYFDTMRAEGLLDLESRPNKTPGGYSLSFVVAQRPFIFTNATGVHDDIQTLLHEGGHSFHTFEMARLPYVQQKREGMMPMEFAEVASLGMELLAAPYLTTEYGGFYTEAEAARARLGYLRDTITFWPYMAMIDALQHWIYEHETSGGDDLEAVDDYWVTLVDRFWPDLDWTGLEREKRASWHRQGHVFTDPFYYIEYGIAQLGAVQIWGNALRDQAGAVAAYRRALALGATVSLPDLYAAAGIRFAFDAATLREAVDLIERQIAVLEPIAQG